MVSQRLFIGKNILKANIWPSLLALIGLVDSIYLVFIKYANNRAFCLPGIGDCYDVNRSSYSEIMGIPIALLGAGAYLSILVVLWLERRNSFFSEYGSYFVFGITLIGTIYSLYLTYIEVAVLKAICPFCVVSAVLMLLLLIISTARLAKGASENHL